MWNRRLSKPLHVIFNISPPHSNVPSKFHSVKFTAHVIPLEIIWIMIQPRQESTASEQSLNNGLVTSPWCLSCDHELKSTIQRHRSTTSSLVSSRGVWPLIISSIALIRALGPNIWCSLMICCFLCCLYCYLSLFIRSKIFGLFEYYCMI